MTTATPRVSVIVRSMGRPELAAALGALARQDHDALEVIVVDATGGRHPPLPQVEWRTGHQVRLVSTGRRLPRPDAANVGLEAARGEWFTFLDDDDSCQPTHVSGLLAGAREHPHALVVYGRGRLRDAAGRVLREFGQPFNRALMHFGPLFYWQAALIATHVRALGCRFDPAFDICEDRDFLAQVAMHGDFAFVPVSTFDYRPDLGTSGTGVGANRAETRRILFDTRLRAKWSGQGAYHCARVATRCREGVRAFLAGDVDGAERWFEAALADYPGDPNAQNGLARVALARGDARRASRLARAALELNPLAAEYHETLGLVRAQLTRSATTLAGRNAMCPCGSGERFKRCCGAPQAAGARATVDAAPGADARASEEAVHASEAAPSDDALAPVLADARAALARGDAARALRVLADAEPREPDGTFGRLVQDCCDALCADERREGLWREAMRLIDLHARGTRRFDCVAASETEGVLVVDVHDGTLAPRLAQRPAAVAIRVDGDHPDALVERLVEMGEHAPHVPIVLLAASEDVVTRLGGHAVHHDARRAAQGEGAAVPLA